MQSQCQHPCSCSTAALCNTVGNPSTVGILHKLRRKPQPPHKGPISDWVTCDVAELTGAFRIFVSFLLSSPAHAPCPPLRNMAATATLPRSIPAHAYDMAYYARCGLAGGLCCSITHTVLVPLDVVKTRMQTHPVRCRACNNDLKLRRSAHCGWADAQAQHPNPSAGFRQIVRAEGARALLLGLTPTAIGCACAECTHAGTAALWGELTAVRGAQVWAAGRAEVWAV